MKFPRHLFEDFSQVEYLRAKEEKGLLALIEQLVALGLLVKHKMGFGSAEYIKDDICVILKFEGNYYVLREYVD